ncbi:MAG TPA: hypothetical protein VE604_01690 [Candidatus Polarisedimenticolia bacterium]|jgi:hypothetical protein|nr:hypothetical protein [Candidatus Polarisedimenticolia bacterium]
MANWAWPEIIDEDSARDAAHMAGGWAGVVAGLTTLFALISIAGGMRIMGIGPLSLIDAALFGVVAWRTWCGSRAFAVAGLSLYGLEVLYGVVTHPPGIGVLTVIILLALINGVRGTVGLHKFEEINRQQMMMSPPTPMAYQAAMPSTSVPPPPPMPDQPK